MRSGPALAATLALYDFGARPLDGNGHDDKQSQNCSTRGGFRVMRAVDMRRWLRFLSGDYDADSAKPWEIHAGLDSTGEWGHRITLPSMNVASGSRTSGKVEGTAKKAPGGKKSTRLLDEKEIALVIDAVEYRRMGEEKERGRRKAKVTYTVRLVSVPTLWDLLCEQCPALRGGLAYDEAQEEVR